MIHGVTLTPDAAVPADAAENRFRHPRPQRVPHAHSPYSVYAASAASAASSASL